MKIIAASLLDDYLESGALIIDLRSEEEYRHSHIRGAVNIPEEKLEHSLRSLSRSQTIVLYCQRGASSVAAGRRLAHAGYRVVSVNGGISAYRGRYLEK